MEFLGLTKPTDFFNVLLGSMHNGGESDELVKRNFSSSAADWNHPEKNPGHEDTGSSSPDNVLGSEFTVGHLTARQALEVLEERELFSGQHGVGTLTWVGSSMGGMRTEPFEVMSYNASESTINFLCIEIFPTLFRDPFSL